MSIHAPSDIEARIKAAEAVFKPFIEGSLGTLGLKGRTEIWEAAWKLAQLRALVWLPEGEAQGFRRKAFHAISKKRYRSFPKDFVMTLMESIGKEAWNRSNGAQNPYFDR